MSKVLIPLAQGFEEIEAITNIDVLRRAGIEVTTISLNSLDVKGDHGIPVIADQRIDQINIDEFDAIVLPGGMPGAVNLRDSKKILDFVRKIEDKDGLVGAICAAPIVLEAAGILEGKKATSYPGFSEEMPSCEYLEERVVKDGNIITARGPGVALGFALEVVEYLNSESVANKLKEDMIADS
ncbi:MAG: DJ-1/PfpI family protein [Halanaerobiales bacterium]